VLDSDRPATEKIVCFCSPVKSGIHPKVPNCYQNDRQQVGQIEIPSEPTIEQMEQEHGDADADSANGVEEEETTRERASRVEGRGPSAGRESTPHPVPLLVRGGEGGVAEGPKLIPDEVVDKRDFRSAYFADGDVQTEHSRVGEQEQDTHIHEYTTAAHDAEFDEAGEEGEKG